MDDDDMRYHICDEDILPEKGYEIKRDGSLKAVSRVEKVL